MEFVVVESPFATSKIKLANGNECEILQADNVAYARACLHDCLVNHNQAPYASHLLYTQEGILDDDIPDERKLGIEAGLEIGRFAKRRIFYVDRGFSSGMKWGFQFAQEIDQVCEIRRLGGKWDVGWSKELSINTLIDRLRD
jgi:hypothetical protein